MGPTQGDLPDQAGQALRLAEGYVFGTDPGRLPALLHRAFEAASDDRTRAALGAALARCWAYAGEHARALPFAEAAVALAETSGDRALLADALDAALATHWGPDQLAARTELARRLDDATAHVTDLDARTRAHVWMLNVALERLDLPAVNRQVRALEVLGEQSDRALFFATSRRLTVDLLRGRTDSAADLVARAGAAADRAGLADGWLVVSSMQAYAAVHAGDRDTAARLAQQAEDFALAQGIREVCAEAAWLWLGAGELPRATALAEGFDADVLSGLPKDFSYLPVLQLLLDVALRGGELDLVRRIVPLLSPYAGRAVVASGGVMFHGLTDDTLSRAADACGDGQLVGRLRARALRTYARVGATWWRERLERWTPDGVHPGPAGTSLPAEVRMTLRPGPAGTWLVGHSGTTTAVPARRGMAHLHTLLMHAGRDVTALTLVGGVVTEGHLGPRADATALAAYRRRLQELDGQLDAADAAGDAAAAEQACTERAAVLAEVSAATGLGGRPRTMGGGSERARVTVRKALVTAIGAITTADPVVGRHLAARVRTGFTCVYLPDPDRPTTWEL